ncbi:MAG: hypothetical protein APF76_09045 [Desulfitibacter sp. BRH_c19]|nr:MAG: hypothetical protein APF76_09045 [Desulfitibacter sp. BRH_c19]
MNRITFLGSGGARIMLSTQILATGGMVVKLDDTLFSLDPGPGALINIFRHKIRPTTLNGIIVSHRHLDHSADINVMIEAMTKGGLEKKGQVFAPSDALDIDPVVLKYLRSYVKQVSPIKPLSNYHINNLAFTTSMPHHHGKQETYGFIFHGSNTTLGYIPDTAFFPELLDFYKTDVLIISMLRLEKSPVLHLCVNDVEKIINSIRPRKTILTHFGIQVFQKGPECIAKYLAEKTNLSVTAATDGLTLEF